MKLLSLHCDYIKYEALKKALKTAELEKGQEGKHEIKDPLVILTAVEKGDSLSSVKVYVDNIKDIASQVKAKKIVLYPYAHLSSNLASPDIAVQVLQEAEKQLKAEKFEVTRAPFGYYKEFELKCKGHPLSELSREIKSGDVKIDEKILQTAKGKELVVEEAYNPEQLLRQIGKSKLDTSKLKENDHRILGQQMDLWSFNDVAPGMPFFHHKGLILYNEMLAYLREEQTKLGYQEVNTPQIMDKKLWQISGHWEKYMNNIFLTKYEGREFAVKPMSCPGGILVFKNRPRSYKELPLKMAEFGVVHRQELSGVLAGLFRVIKFTQDDAHYYCKENQLEDGVAEILDLVDRVYKKMGIKLDHVELSTRPEKRIGEDKLWDKAEKILEATLKKLKMNYKLNPGDGAFYGPKIDFHLKDSLGRMWQCGTIQLDFAMPERFDLYYTDEDNKEKRPVMLHRAIFGSIERFLGILTEHLNGNFPLWLNPNQVKVMSLTDRNAKFAEKIAKQFQEEGIRVELDVRTETMDKKVRDAQMNKFNYMITIGDKEEANKTLAVRSRGGKVKFGVKVEDFLVQIKEEIKERK